MLVAYTAILCLVNELKWWIANSFEPAIRQDLESDCLTTQQIAQRRLRDLKSWKAAEYPFAWNQPNERPGATRGYVISFTSTLAQPQDLTSAAENQTYETLADLFIRLGHYNRENTVYKWRAPFIHNGLAAHCLLRAYWYMHRKASSEEMRAIWVHVLQKLKVQFLPWHRNPTPNSSRSRPSAVSSTTWLSIQQPSLQRPSPLLAQQIKTAGDIAEEAAQQQPTIAWSVPSHLGDMGGLWNKTVLPRNWSLTEASVSGSLESDYVVETYRWVEENFDGSRVDHRLGLILGIMFARIIPNVFYANDDLQELKKTHNINELNQALRKLKWTPPRSGKKGASDPRPYLTMVSTAIIALLDERSPLQTYLSKNDNTFGKHWTNKHSALIHVIFYFISIKFKYPFPATKGIGMMNFIRIGVAKARSTNIFTSPRYNRDWIMINHTEQETLLQELEGALKMEQWGLFYAFCHIFGKDLAISLGPREFLIPPTAAH